MKIVFFGTSEFAIEPLKALLASKHRVLALVTQPDRKKGRNLKLSPPPTKMLALAHSIPVYQPVNASGKDALEYLKSLSADLFVVISFGQILKKEILSIPRLYAINLHGSLLPKYRGAAPTNWAVINGDKTTGVTIIKMNERMDEGDIITSADVGIDEEDTNITLTEKLSATGAKLLLETIGKIEGGPKEFSFMKQDLSRATYAPKLKKADGLIDWSIAAQEIHNRVRGLLPWPGAYTYYSGKALKILKTVLGNLPDAKTTAPGEVIDIVKDKGIIVRTGSGSLVVSRLQLEGKKAMHADSFVRGHKIEPGYSFRNQK
jgi:methionyl-tRNA formyltransferase